MSVWFGAPPAPGIEHHPYTSSIKIRAPAVHGPGKLDVPRRGIKELVFLGTPEQRAKLKRKHSELYRAFAQPRGAQSKHLPVGNWDAEAGVVRITKPRGRAQQSMGITNDRQELILSVEEALYLMERSDLCVLVEGVPISIQQGTQLLSKAGFPLSHFIVYAYYRRAGYVVVRTGQFGPPYHDPRKGAAAEEPRKKRRREDAEAPESGLHSEKIGLAPLPSDRRFTLPGDYLAPPPAFGTGVFGRAISSLSRMFRRRPRPSAPSPPPAAASPPQFPAPEPEDKHPIHGEAPMPKTRKGLFDPLQITPVRCFTEQHAGTSASAYDDKDISVVFDVYQPGSKFRKSAPPLPTFRICVARYEDPVPSLATFQRLAQASHPIPVKFAIVDHGTVVSFEAVDAELPVVN